MMGGAIFPFIVNSYVHGTSKPPRNILERFFFPVTLHVIFPPCTMKYFARQVMSLGRWPTIPIFHDRNTMFVAERSSIGIRLRRQLFANYRVPVDSVDVKASDNTGVY